jgi:ATP adenylyltransferase
MDRTDRVLKPGSLWSTLLERTAHARRCGAIQSIPTTSELVEEGGIAFQVRVVTALAKKEEDRLVQPAVDPFLPYDPDLFVADISPTHVALLNKFNVVEHHLLIVTRSFEEQETLLTKEDCAALLIGLAEIDGLAFYNAGTIAGASQRHRHLQLIPLPASIEPRLPIEPLLRTAQPAGATGTVPGLPFLHAYAPLDPAWIDRPLDGAFSLLACYRSLLRAVGLALGAGETAKGSTAPYNLLATRQWLLLVPRARECFQGISINALGFAGALLVQNKAELEVLMTCGPLTALRHVTLPRDS